MGGESRKSLQSVEILMREGFFVKKRIISSIVSTIMILSLAMSATAASHLTEIKAYLNHGINITLNGQPWTPPQTPITYEGSTYLPVRAVAEAVGINVDWDAETQTVLLGDEYDVVLEFPADRFPQTAAHIASAILAGKSAVCTIDRDGADERREASLAGIPTRDGYDRDEWPMAICEEGGAGADVTYIESGDNRGAGAWVGNALEKYPDGARVKFVVTFGELDADAKRSGSSGKSGESVSNGPFASCAEARAAGKAPLYRGDPGYSTKLDRDGDGVACE